MKKAAFCFIMIFLMLFSLPGLVFAQDTGAGAGASAPGQITAVGRITAVDRITAVSVSGLKRTRPQVAEQALQKFIGREAAKVDLNEVKAAILDTGILEPVTVEIADADDGAGKIIRAEVLDKWSIFPVPIAFTDFREKWSVGAAFYDANAFGLNQKAVLMGAYGGEGWNATGMYFNPPSKGRPGWSAQVSFARKERKDVDQTRETTLRRFNQDAINASGSVSYKWTEFLSGSLRLGYSGRFLGETDAPIGIPDSDAQVLRMGPELSIRRSSWDGYLLSEESASLSYNFMLGLAGTASFNSLHFEGLYQKSILPGFRADIRTGLLYTPEVPVLFESPPGEAAVSILPSSFSARHYAGLSLGLEKHLYRFSFGAVSLLLAAQMVYSDGSILKNQFDYGVASSVSLYLSKLAIPAVGFGAAYNISANDWEISFSLGMSY